MITFPHLGYLGRLGNQMFQYSSLIGIAKNNNLKYFLPRKDIELLSCFNIDTEINCFYNRNFAAPNNLDCTQCVSGNQVYLKSEGENAKFLDTNFDLNFFNANHDEKSIVGFFQNRKYFENVEDILREKFTFKKKYSTIANNYFSELFPDKNVISLHIRRTDYINSYALNNLDINYYENALDLFNKNISVLIFSDDIKWCKSQKLFNSNRFLFMESDNTYIDLCLMSLCNYHIIANSTFSWWGSWLAKSKKTICPKQWFLPYCSYLDSDGLRLKEWISI